MVEKQQYTEGGSSSSSSLEGVNSTAVIDSVEKDPEFKAVIDDMTQESRKKNETILIQRETLHAETVKKLERRILAEKNALEGADINIEERKNSKMWWDMRTDHNESLDAAIEAENLDKEQIKKRLDEYQALLTQAQENYKKTQDAQTGGDEALQAGDYQKAQELYNQAAQGISHQNQAIKDKIGESTQLADNVEAQAELGKEIAGGIRTTAIVVGATIAAAPTGGASLAALGNAVAIGTTAGAIGQIYEQGGEVIFNNKDGAEAFIDGAKGTGKAALDSALAGTGMMSGLKVAGMAGKAGYGALSTGMIAGGVNTATQSAARTGIDVSKETATFFVENGDKMKDLSASEIANVYTEHMAKQGLAPDQIAKNFAFDVATGALGGGVGAKFGPLQEAAKGAMKHLGMHAGEVGSDAALAVLSAHARSYMNTGTWDASPEDIQKELINTLTGSLTGKYASVRQRASQSGLVAEKPTLDGEASEVAQTGNLVKMGIDSDGPISIKGVDEDVIMREPLMTRKIGLEGHSLKDEITALKSITNMNDRVEKIQQIRDMVQKDRDISDKIISLRGELLEKRIDGKIPAVQLQRISDIQSEIDSLIAGTSVETRNEILERVERFKKSNNDFFDNSMELSIKKDKIGLEGLSLTSEVHSLKSITDVIERKKKIQQIRDMVQRDRDLSIEVISQIEESLQICVKNEISPHRWREIGDTQSKIDILLKGCSIETRKAITERIERFQKSKDYQLKETKKEDVGKIVKSYFQDVKLADSVYSIERSPYGMNFLIDADAMEGFRTSNSANIGQKTDTAGFARAKIRSNILGMTITDNDSVAVFPSSSQDESIKDHEVEHLRHNFINGKNVWPERSVKINTSFIKINPTIAKQRLIREHRQQVDRALMCAQNEVFSFLVQTKKYGDWSRKDVQESLSYTDHSYGKNYLGKYEDSYEKTSSLFSEADTRELLQHQKDIIGKYDLVVNSMVDFANDYITKNGGYNRELVDRLRITPMTDWPSLMPGSRWQRGDFIL